MIWWYINKSELNYFYSTFKTAAYAATTANNALLYIKNKYVCDWACTMKSKDILHSEKKQVVKSVLERRSDWAALM